MKEIVLNNGMIATVDDDDYDKVAAYRWRAEARPRGCFYAVRTIIRDGRPTTIRMHQIVLPGSTRKLQIDHKDGNGLNNARTNLRFATRQQNTHNSRGRIDGLKGVTYQPRLRKRPWQARIAFNGKENHIGYFATKYDAAAAYDERAKQLHGEFARLNGASADIAGPDFWILGIEGVK